MINKTIFFVIKIVKLFTKKQKRVILKNLSFINKYLIKLCRLYKLYIKALFHLKYY